MAHEDLASAQARAVLSRYEIAVGSTGNLGLAIGTMGSALGLRAVVHMSSDAKAWKKARLRDRGVQVVEHAGDYADAVAAGRRASQDDARSHFVDDERSGSLFAGYAAAARHFAMQLAQAGRTVDGEHPLFVYLPCGVGGAPGGIATGLHQIYGEHVHCFFAEPVQSPCFLLQMLVQSGPGPLGGLGPHPSIYDVGLSNRTEADGLAVPSASILAAATVKDFIGGVYTVEDETLFALLHDANVAEGIRIEPSAAAGFAGPAQLLGCSVGQDYLRRQDVLPHLAGATHVVWTTGGLFVPEEEYAGFLARGKRVSLARAS
jgi:D-serine dehydratase